MYARMYVSPSALVGCIPAFVRALVRECACVCARRLDVYHNVGMYTCECMYMHVHVRVDSMHVRVHARTCTRARVGSGTRACPRDVYHYVHASTYVCACVCMSVRVASTGACAWLQPCVRVRTCARFGVVRPSVRCASVSMRAHQGMYGCPDAHTHTRIGGSICDCL
jgi:hypothetical protein